MCMNELDFIRSCFLLQLYMLAEGNCIYRGTIKNLIPYLSSQSLMCPQYHNPADYGKCLLSFLSDGYKHRLQKFYKDMIKLHDTNIL